VRDASAHKQDQKICPHGTLISVEMSISRMCLPLHAEGIENLDVTAREGLIEMVTFKKRTV
jgi:hypothetical protein